jgi:two-component system chemotaxis sensor kinase CheA
VTESTPPSTAVLLEKAALAAVGAASGKPATLTLLATAIDELAAGLASRPEGARVRAALVELEGASGDAEASKKAVASIGELLDRLEFELSSPPLAPDPRSDGKTTLRDAETLELFRDFLSESEDGLDKADEILLAAEQGGAGSEEVNALFRVFHSIKGISACLDASEVTGLAHVTETLLGQVREGRMELGGIVIDAVLQSSAAMRRLLAAVRRAVDGDEPIPAEPSVTAVVRSVEAVSSGKDLAANGQALAPAGEGGATALPAASIELPERGAEQTPGTRLRETVKVDLERIDSVVEMIGELIIVESLVVNAPEVTAISSLKVRNYLSQLTKISRDLQSVAMRMRMVPVRGVFQKMARMARDLSKKTGKSVQLLQFGETTEMDRSMVERIEDPLMHMIRNALDHAIETPEERRAAGKPVTGTLKLSASHEGGSVVIRLSDDGRGLRREAILKKARQQGLIPDAGTDQTDSEVFNLIFRPGFSTAAKVTEISGRGVGMDVVKRNVEEMRGRVVLDSVAGQGTSFEMVLPLTLAIIDGMIVSCGSERYIVPSLSIVQSFQPTKEMLRNPCDSGEQIALRGELLPLLRLREFLGVAGADPPIERAQVVVVEGAGKKFGLLVDDVLAQQQVVIKPLGETLSESEFLAGGAILSDGLVGLILNVDRLANLFGAKRRGTKETREAAA